LGSALKLTGKNILDYKIEVCFNNFILIQNGGKDNDGFQDDKIANDVRSFVIEGYTGASYRIFEITLTSIGDDKSWGFMHATNGSISYVSNVINYPAQDGNLGYPNTKLVRSWRLELKAHAGSHFHDKDFTLELIWNDSNYNMKYRSKLEAMEARDRFISKLKGFGRKVVELRFDY
jgi:hypothetical protein